MSMRMMSGLTGLSGALLVALGAMKGHGLFDERGEQAVAWLGTALQYGMWHTAVLAALCLASQQGGLGRLAAASAYAFGAGIVLFCGSLIILALTGADWVTAAMPVGGTGFVSGWLLLGLAGLRSGRQTT